VWALLISQEKVATPLTAAFLSVVAPAQVRVAVSVPAEMDRCTVVVESVVSTVPAAFSTETPTVNVWLATVLEAGSVVTASFDGVVVAVIVKVVVVAEVSPVAVAVST
jgi:hypothetical protein